MTGERPRPATPDDVLDAIEALTRSNEQLREQVAQLEAIVRNQPPMRVRRVEPLPVRYPAAPQPGPALPPYAPPHVVTGPRPPAGPPQQAPWTPPPAPAAQPTRTAPRVTGPVVIAVAGVVVLLAGVAMLLVLAAQHGYFGPLARVIGCAVLAVGLLIIAAVVHRRQPDNAGALALAGAGLAAGYLDVTAMTWLLDVPVRPAMVVAGVVALAGLALAWWWDTQIVAVIATVGALVLVPVVAAGDALTATAFLVLLTLVTAPASWRDGWFVLLGCRILPTVLTLVVFVALAGAQDPMVPRLRLAAALLAALGYADHWALPAMRRVLARVGPRSEESTERVAAPTASTLDAHALSVPVLALPLWVAAMVAPAGWAALLALPLAAVAAVHWWTAKFPTMAACCTVVTAMGLSAVPVAALDGSTRMLSLALMGIVFAILHRLSGQLPALVIAALLALIGLPDGLTRVGGPGAGLDVGEIVTAAGTGLAELGLVVLVLVLLGEVAAVHSSRPHQGSARSGWTVAGVAAGCLLLQGPVIAACTALTAATGFPSDAEVAGRGVTTLLMAVVVTGLLLRSRGSDRASAVRRTSGYVLMGVILVKLCLYDLVVLHGVIRVVAFIGVGLLMLGLATVYSRSLRSMPHARPSGDEATRPQR